MHKGKIGLVVVIAIAVLLTGTYAVYAASYQGNYNVTVKGTAQVAYFGMIAVNGVTATSHAASYGDVWSDLLPLKGHSARPSTAMPNAWTIYVEFNSSGHRETKSYVWEKNGTFATGDQLAFTFEFKNKPAGDAKVRVYVWDDLEQLKFDRTTLVTVR